MAAVDAQFYWMSAKIPNDQFPLYAFDGEPRDLERARKDVRRRARACPDLSMRVDDACMLTYPQWVPAAIGPEHDDGTGHRGHHGVPVRRQGRDGIGGQ
ncbi:hypothetical protein LAUMK35_01235 [Mycobacterium pseudokansasii]|uniref:Uncharacterized protein n=1 Tax=Mycobacterium pseudokansasii TaxID=2341080 RepID=A0A498QS39_9MYCO|nr:hypothetical protein A4G27_19125 [Mycobacterium kansasii]VAZ90202.1 hypothetical protein LAUMK35_01235 [Mycobacterium pseudokansasii]VAZ91041.1 hypothetical protein LAUMK21_01235 [Mycobacterium pseudokansasii]VBA48103.1 hypothetical protein LAUMK142_01118 [Mycobacterium pseudokansasii]